MSRGVVMLNEKNLKFFTHLEFFSHFFQFFLDRFLNFNIFQFENRMQSILSNVKLIDKLKEETVDNLEDIKK